MDHGTPSTTPPTPTGEDVLSPERLVGRLDLFELADDVLSLHDTDGSLLFVSGGCHTFLGVEQADLADRGFSARVHARDAGTLTDLLAGTGVAEDGRGGQATVRLRHASGARVWAELNARRETLDDGREVVVLVWRDVTARRQLDSFARLLQRITAASNDSEASSNVLASVAADIAGTLGWTPLGAWRVDGDTVQAIEGFPADTSWLTATPGAAEQCERVRLRLRDQPRPVCEEIAAAEGPARDRRSGVIGVPCYADGTLMGILEFGIAEVLESHQPLASLFDEPLTELMNHIGAQLGLVLQRERHLQALERANAELARSNAELEQFAYVASHDLHEPLRKVASFCSLLQRRYGEQLDADGQEFIAFAVDGALRMQRLINDLLAYSRVGRGGQSPARVALSRVVDRVLADLDGLISDNGARVVTAGDLPAVWARPDDAVALVSNLVTNALKYREPDTAPLVQIAAAINDEWVELSVTDNGIGIEPHHQERIFGIFQRLHPTSAYPGTGIGLALCRRIAQAYGGDVACVSTPGAGSTFTVTLPRIPEGAS